MSWKRFFASWHSESPLVHEQQYARRCFVLKRVKAGAFRWNVDCLTVATILQIKSFIYWWSQPGAIHFNPVNDMTETTWYVFPQFWMSQGADWFLDARALIPSVLPGTAGRNILRPTGRIWRNLRSVSLEHDAAEFLSFCNFTPGLCWYLCCFMGGFVSAFLKTTLEKTHEIFAGLVIVMDPKASLAFANLTVL